MLLILTIVHFILKNYLVQREIVNDTSVQVKSTEKISRKEAFSDLDEVVSTADGRYVINKNETAEVVVKTTAPIAVEKPLVSKNSGKLEGNKCKTNMEELYNFVYDDETGPMDKSLDKLYNSSNNVELDIKKIPNTVVDDSCVSNDLYKTPKVICDEGNYIDEIFKKSAKPRKELKGNREEIGNGSFSVIQEYAQENTMNGERFANLKGYDVLDSHFAFASLS